MAKNILVVSCDIPETRVALIESGIIAELHIERPGAHPRGGAVGDIYLGKVTRVLPGLQAAFVDIGLERAAFLHVEDLIRPDDFEAYLAGGRKHAREGGGAALEAHDPEDSADAEPVSPPAEATSLTALPEHAPQEAASEDLETPGDDTSTERDADANVSAAEPAESAADRADDEGWGDSDPSADAAAALASAASIEEPDDDAAFEAPDDDQAPTAPDDDQAPTAPDDDQAPAAADDDQAPTPADDDQAFTGPADPYGATPANDERAPAGGSNEPALAGADDELDDLLDNPNLPGFTISDSSDPVPRAPAPPLDRPRDGRGGGGGGGDARRRRGRGRDRGRGNGNSNTNSRGREPAPSNARARPTNQSGRLSKSTPIRDVVKEGQDIIVQITKEPIGTKGARCSSHVSLSGRYVVYLPTLEHVGISKRIGSEKERARLRETIESMKPPSGGLIVRTLAEGLTKKQLKQDVGYLVRLWGEVAKKHEGAKAPAVLMSELDIVLKTARDLFTDDVDELVIDDRTQYERVCRFVEMFMPDRLKDVVYYGDDEPIFDAYGIEDEISRALSRKVPLPSGGYLVIDEAEALTAIDVNTGRFVGKGSKDMEETVLKTNLEAVHEIAYQLRFRNIGGLIILDLIDMEKASNRETVRKTLDELLQRDKAKTTLNRISELGLIEMTRKRTRESLGRLLHEPCFYCDGTGHLQSKETVAYEILREIRRRREGLPGYTIAVTCHPAVADFLTSGAKTGLQEAESRYMRRIHVTARTEYHLEQFDLSGK
jgi:ribonuclease G